MAKSVSKLGNHDVIRHSYNHTITALARLHSFATDREVKGDGPVEEHKAVLARDDMVMLAIHARRLLENTIALDNARAPQMRCMLDGKGGTASITKVIDMIIHHKELDLYTSDIVFQIAAVGIETICAALAQGQRSRKISPVCRVISDRCNVTMFKVIDLVDGFSLHLLSKVIDLCLENRLVLEDL